MVSLKKCEELYLHVYECHVWNIGSIMESLILVHVFSWFVGPDESRGVVLVSERVQMANSSTEMHQIPVTFFYHVIFAYLQSSISIAFGMRFWVTHLPGRLEFRFYLNSDFEVGIMGENDFKVYIFLW